MTTPNHAAQGIIIGMMTGLPWQASLISGMLMASPDVPVWVDSIKFMLHARRNNWPKWWTLRLWRQRPLSHKVTWWSVAGVVMSAVGAYFGVPGWPLPSFHLIHILEDLPFHKEEGGINKWYVPVEVGLWAAIALVIVFKFII